MSIRRPARGTNPEGGAQRARLSRRVVIPVVVLWTLASVGFAIAIGVRAPDPQLAGRLYAAASAAALLTLLIARLSLITRSGSGPRFEEILAVEAAAEPQAPPGLSFIEQSIRFATSSAGDLHMRLRPVVRQVAAHRLAGRHIGLDTPAHQETAEAILGPVMFDLVRKDRPPPDLRFAPGITRESIEQIIKTLEELA